MALLLPVSLPAFSKLLQKYIQKADLLAAWVWNFCFVCCFVVLVIEPNHTS